VKAVQVVQRGAGGALQLASRRAEQSGERAGAVRPPPPCLASHAEVGVMEAGWQWCSVCVCRQRRACHLPQQPASRSAYSARYFKRVSARARVAAFRPFPSVAMSRLKRGGGAGGSSAGRRGR